jgi:hypothetical protein
MFLGALNYIYLDVTICVLVGLPLLLGGVCFTHIFIMRHMRFVKVEGRIVEAEAYTVDAGDVTHELSLVCEYIYSGKVYRGSPYYLDPTGQTRPALDHEAQHLPGTSVHVFCNPDHPEEFVLRKRITVLNVFTAAVVIGCGVLLLLSAVLLGLGVL